MSSNKRRQPLQPFKTQFLGFVEHAVCRECGKKVKWRIRSSYHCADGKHIKQYLQCPTKGCNGRATRLIDEPDPIF